MTLPSRVLGSGISGLSTVAICGDGQDNVTAVGTSASDATQLVAVMTSVDTTSPGSGVKLPKAEMGALVFISNSGAHTLTVYPQTGDTINNTTSAAIAQNHSSVYFGIENSGWYSLNGQRS